MRLVHALANWRLAIGCAVLALAGCTNSTTPSGQPAAGPGQRYIILENGHSPFWDAARAGLEDAAKELGVVATLEGNDGTPQGQITRLRQFASQSDIAAIGISVTDAANATIADELRKLQAKGLKIVTIDSDVDRAKFRDARFAFIGTDNRIGGRELGVCAKHLRPEGGGFVQFVGRTGAQNAIERMDGFVEGAGEKFRELDRMGDEIDRTKARENVRNAIRNHPDLKVLVGIWSYNAPAIVDVVRELGRRDQFTIVTFDAEPLAIGQLGDGDIDAMVVQNPYQMGYQGVRLMKALVTNDQATIKEMFPKQGQPEGDLYDTGLKVVVRDSSSPLRREMFGQQTEFLLLDAFRKWLAKYDLKGS